MRKLIAIILFAINIQNLSTNITTLPKEQPIEYYLNRYQIYQNFIKIYNRANKILEANLSHTSAPLAFPTDLTEYTKISGEYGIREKHPILKYTTLHKGIDITNPFGTNVYASANGVIIRKGYHILGYGKFIEIDHGNKVSTIYAHLSKTNVSVGDSVKIGDTIGKIGSTGLSTGPHLHYEIRKNGIAINPSLIFECKGDQFIIKNIITKFVQMNTKIITKNLTLSELKELKDTYTNDITSLEYNIKNGEISKLSTLKKTFDKIQIKQENLIRVKDLLAKANSIESSNDQGQIYSNNTNIYKLSLLRDLRKTINDVSNKNQFNEYATEVVNSLTAEINEIDSNIRAFNTNTKIEIQLLEE